MSTKVFLLIQQFLTTYTSIRRYLAHEIEEDWVLLRREIVPWFPVAKYESNYAEMLKIKNNIWNRMNYECFVTKDMCDQVRKFSAYLLP